MRINRFAVSVIAAAMLMSGCSNHPAIEALKTPQPVAVHYLPVTPISVEEQREAYAYYSSAERRQRIQNTMQAIGKDLLEQMLSGKITYKTLSYSNAGPAPTNGYGRLVANRTGAKITEPGAKQVTLFVRFVDGKVDNQLGPLGFQIAYGGWFYYVWGETALTIRDHEVIAVKDGPLSYDWRIGEIGEDATQGLTMFLTGGGQTGPRIPEPPQQLPLAVGAPYVVWVQGGIAGSNPASVDDIRFADSTVGRAFENLHNRFNWQS
jgi:hypothetical protein